jgi:protein-glutamine gamma-glutamyltransferase
MNITARRKRPQLTREELQQLRWLLGGMLMLLGGMTVVYIEVDAWILLAVTLGATVATTFWPTLPARVPRLVHVLAFPFIVAFFAVDLWLRSELLPAMVRLDMLLLLYRALVYRQRRDDLQVIVLGLFLVVVAGVLTVSLGFALQILAYAACALVFLFVITIADAAKGNVAGTVADGATGTAGAGAAASWPPPWAAHANWGALLARVRAVIDWRVVALSTALFVGVVGVSALLFLVIPRFQLDNGMFLDRFITRKARTGFTDAIRFGDVTQIQQDTSVALHVDVSDPGQIPLTPYWRMLVLNEYADGQFRLSPALRRQQFGPERTGMGVLGRLRPRPNRATWTFYLEPGVSRYLPLLAEFQRLRFGEAQNFQTTRDLGVVALTKEPVTMTAYQVEGFDLSARLRDRPGSFYGGTGASPARAPDAAADAPQQATLRRLVNAATGGVELTAGDFAARVGAWLRAQHPYSLSPNIPDGPADPLVRWADSRGAGHCELFAGTFVLLARTAGFPARVVTGFRGGTWNAFSNSFTVRNSDAHAWAEIFDRESSSWIRADPLELPTSAQVAANADAVLAHRTDRSWSARLDSLRVFWYRRIVSFDQQAQINTLKAAKETAQSVLHRLRERAGGVVAALRAWWRLPWDAGRLASVVTLTLVAAGLTWGWRRLRIWALQSAFWRRASRREDPIRREAGRWLQRLAERREGGWPNDPVTPQLQRLRFGARETWPEAAAVFRRARKLARTPGTAG